MDATQFITLSATVVTAAAAVFGAWIAYLGVDTWRKQIVGTNHYDLAKRILVGVFQLEQLIQRMRQPLTMGFVDLWDRLDKQRAELYPSFLEARAVWGTTLAESEKRLAQAITKLQSSRYWQEQADREDVSEEQREQILNEHVEPIRWQFGSTDDAFGNEIHATVEQIETFLRPHLSR